MDRILKEEQKVVEEARRGLTTKQRRFVREMAEDPMSATAAAIRAGYSPKSARTMAYRLLKDPDIQSELAQHFVDEEKEVSEALKDTILRLHGLVGSGSDDKFLKAAKLLLEYTRLATGILGLEVKREKSQADAPAAVSVEDMIEHYKRELEKLERLHAGGFTGSPSAPGAGLLPN